ncbi:MAG: adenosine deaminase [Anaerolineales bacterium]|nr:adenosine deaminase [Anaerolineales bacterium]
MQLPWPRICLAFSFTVSSVTVGRTRLAGPAILMPSPSRADLAALPKLDLHRHLEGALRLTTLRAIAQQHGLDLPADSLAALRPYVQVVDGERSFRQFLAKFDVLRRFYLSPEIIHRLAFEVIEDAARDNLHYLELRFTPAALASSGRFSLADVTDWVIAAVAEAGRVYPKLQVRLIVSVNRHEPVALAEQVAQVAADRQARGIAGLDLAGDEVNFPAAPFRGVFQAARQAGLGCVAHAGEWTGAAAVRDAIEHLGVRRVGHGVRVVEDPAAVALARERAIVFEVCLTSNLQSGVVAAFAAHALPRMNALGLRTTLNTDDPGVSGITLSDEYQIAVDALGLSWADLQQALFTAADASLLPPAERAALAARLRAALDRLDPVSE